MMNRDLTMLERSVLLELANKGKQRFTTTRLAAARRLADRDLVDLDERTAKITDAGRKQLTAPVADRPRYLRAAGTGPTYPAGPGPHDDPAMEEDAARGYTGRPEKRLTGELEAVDDAALEQYAVAARARDDARTNSDPRHVAARISHDLRGAA